MLRKSWKRKRITLLSSEWHSGPKAVKLIKFTICITLTPKSNKQTMRNKKQNFVLQKAANFKYKYSSMVSTRKSEISGNRKKFTKNRYAP